MGILEQGSNSSKVAVLTSCEGARGGGIGLPEGAAAEDARRQEQ